MVGGMGASLRPLACPGQNPGGRIRGEAPGFYDILDPHMWSNARDDNHSWFTVERTCIFLRVSK